MVISTKKLVVVGYLLWISYPSSLSAISPSATVLQTFVHSILYVLLQYDSQTRKIQSSVPLWAHFACLQCACETPYLYTWLRRLFIDLRPSMRPKLLYYNVHLSKLLSLYILKVRNVSSRLKSSIPPYLPTTITLHLHVATPSASLQACVSLCLHVATPTTRLQSLCLYPLFRYIYSVPPVRHPTIVPE